MPMLFTVDQRYSLIKQQRCIWSKSFGPVFKDELQIIDTLNGRKIVYKIDEESDIPPVNIKITCDKLNNEYYIYNQLVLDFIIGTWTS